MKEYDDTELKPNVRSLIHIIKMKIRECEKYDIDYESYLDYDDFRYIIGVLDCCLEHKDSKHIMRRD